MKDLSFFLLKNAFGAKMKKGIRTFCSSDGSTSTLNQGPAGPVAESPGPGQDGGPTLEEMILQLELEEEMARAHKEDRCRRRMSSVNSSDILRSAQNALSQYPRFSLDGRDSMYMSSFWNSGRPEDAVPARRSLHGPERVGEGVVWCKPGVVAKLMGLDAIPVPVGPSHSSRRRCCRDHLQDLNLRSSIWRQNLRRRAERHELERRVAMFNLKGYGTRAEKERSRLGSGSRTGYCVMKPVAFEPVDRSTVRDWARKHYI